MVVAIVNVLVQAAPSLPVLVFLINHLLMAIVNVLVQAVPSLPVLVFLHGGGYVSGSGSRLLYGPELFMDREVNI